MSAFISVFSISFESLLRERALFAMLGYYDSTQRNKMKSRAFELSMETVRAVLAFADGDGGLSLMHIDSHEIVVIVKLTFL